MKCEYCGRHGYAECCAGCGAPLPFAPQRILEMEFQFQKRIEEQQLGNPAPASPFYYGGSIYGSGVMGKNYR